LFIILIGIISYASIAVWIKRLNAFEKLFPAKRMSLRMGVGKKGI
jgi:hypothetical protein